MSIYVTNLIIYTGTDFEQTFTLADSGNKILDLTGYSGCCEMKKYEQSVSASSFVLSFLDPLQGIIKISMGSSVSSLLNPGKYLYDIVLTDTENITKRIIEGNVLIKKAVTR
jgi:hypothetical protein